MYHAKESDFEKVKEIFYSHKKWFPHIRTDYMKRMIARKNLILDNQIIGSVKLSEMWGIHVPNSGLRCGENRHAPISRDYTPPFILKGLKKVVVDLNLPSNN